MVGVEHLRPPTIHRLGQGLDARAGLKSVGQAGGHYVPAVPVHDRHKVEESPGHGQAGDVGGPSLVGSGDFGLPKQIGIAPHSRRRVAGPGSPVDGPQPYDPHQPLHPLPVHQYTPPLQPRLHPSRPVERDLQVLPVHLPHQGQLLSRGSLGTVVETGTAHTQQCTLPHYRQLGVLPVHHLPPPLQAHGPDLSAKKSRSTFSWPISWYNRGIRAASFLDFFSRSLPKTPAAPSVMAFFQAWSCPGGLRTGQPAGPTSPGPSPPQELPWP